MIRNYDPAIDRESVTRLHREMYMDYQMPDLESPLFVVRKVHIENGVIVGAEFLKIQAEAYLMLSCDLDPIEKTRSIAHLSRATEQAAYEKGIDTLVAYIPDDIVKKFAKRLSLLGWNEARKGWVTWFRELV